MKRSTVSLMLTFALFALASAAQAGDNDKNKKQNSQSLASKQLNLSSLRGNKPLEDKPFHTLPFGKPGKPKPIGQTKPWHHDQQGSGGGNGGGPGNGTGPGTGQGNGQGHGQQHSRPEVTTRPEDLFPNGKPPKPTKPGYVWVDAKSGVPGHWERERAPQTQPGYVWVPATATVPGHWERGKAK